MCEDLFRMDCWNEWRQEWSSLESNLLMEVRWQQIALLSWVNWPMRLREVWRDWICLTILAEHEAYVLAGLDTM